MRRLAILTSCLTTGFCLLAARARAGEAEPPFQQTFEHLVDSNLGEALYGPPSAVITYVRSRPGGVAELSEYVSGQRRQGCGPGRFFLAMGLRTLETLDQKRAMTLAEEIVNDYRSGCDLKSAASTIVACSGGQRGRRVLVAALSSQSTHAQELTMNVTACLCRTDEIQEIITILDRFITKTKSADAGRAFKTIRRNLDNCGMERIYHPPDARTPVGDSSSSPRATRP